MVTQTFGLPVECHFSVLFALFEFAYVSPIVLIDPHANAVSLVLEPCALVLLASKSGDALTASHVMLIHLAHILPPLVNYFLAYPSYQILRVTYLF